MAAIAVPLLLTAALATSVDQGQRQARQAKRAEKSQREAQDRARASASAQQRENEEASNKANRKKPDAGRILAAAQKDALGGVASTFLTGPSGVDPLSDSLKSGTNRRLGGRSLLGG